jgi:hypothetical protein
MPSKLRLLLPFALAVLLALASTQNVSASTEIAYDDGTAESGLSAEPPIEHAVRFSLPPGWSSAKILIARYFIWSNPATFRVHVYGSGVTDPALTVTPVGTGWFNVDLSAYNIVVSGDFYISIEYLSTVPSIGRDTTGPVDFRSYSREPPAFLWVVSGSADLMIRAVVDLIGRGAVGGVVVPTNTFTVLAPYLAVIGLVATTAIAVKKRRN